MKRRRSDIHVHPLVALAAALALLAPGGCFEGGPLDAVAPADTGALDDTVAPADTGADTATQEDSEGLPDVTEEDTATSQDTVAPPDTAQDTLQDTVTGPPCLTVADCAGVVAPGDKCAGTIGCVDYQCVADPATVVSCPDDGDPCTLAACDPATGACVTTDGCTCAPVGTLACGTPVSYATGDPGESDFLDGYSCGGAGASNTGPERVFSFSVPTAQRVRITAEAQAGVGGVWVIGFAGGDCAPDGCLAAGAGTALLDAPAGTPLAVVVEHTFGGWPVTLTAECGITTETRCGDGLDDDGDGQTDCADGDCAGTAACTVTPTTEISCTNTVDDDKDGQTDCDDGDCAGAPACFVATPEDCYDGADNDGDGQADCADPDCAAEASCLQPCINVSPTAATCTFSQGLTTGGGQSHMSQYPGCAGSPTTPSKEVVYPFTAPGSGLVTVSLAWSGAQPLTLFVLADQGQGCAGSGCIGYDAHNVTFSAVAGNAYYFVVDGQVNGVAYNLAVSCSF